MPVGEERFPRFGKGRNKGGAPPMYNTPEELQQTISDYFDHGYSIRKVVVGSKGKEEVVEMPIVSITGLVLFCGFCDRASFYDYEKKPAFAHTIKRARVFIENEYEEAIHSGNPAGPIFLLKNFGWSDKQEIEVTGAVKSVREVIHMPAGSVNQPHDAPATGGVS